MHLHSRLLRLAFNAAIASASFATLLAASLKLTDVATFAEAISLHHRLAGPVPESLAFVLAATQLLLGALMLWLLVERRVSTASLLISASFCALAIYAAWLCFNPPAAPTSCGCGFSRRVYTAADWKFSALANALLAIGFATSASMAQRLFATKDAVSKPMVLAASAVEPECLTPCTPRPPSSAHPRPS